MKLGGQVGCVTRVNRFDFGEVPDVDLDTRIFLSDSSPLRDRDKNNVEHRYFKKLWMSYDKTWWIRW